MAFESEEALVQSFLDVISADATPWGDNLKTAREFDYLRGRTDVVGLSDSGELIAFEAKLKKWRVALNQAYRNTCFANQSYVLLPRAVAERAFARLHEFRRRRVGLCYLDGEKLVILLDAQKGEPLQPWLYERASKLIEESQKSVA
ncbi:MAG: hypothetical protein IH968_19495 [Gemmatimonadetes bacterium]|nr:hypothetical protein [Gemmatimonadota bacterium]